MGASSVGPGEGTDCIIRWSSRLVQAYQTALGTTHASEGVHSLIIREGGAFVKVVWWPCTRLIMLPCGGA